MTQALIVRCRAAWQKVRNSPRVGPAKSLREVLGAYAFVGLLVIAAVFFSIYPETADTFSSAANMRALVSGNAVVAIVALAALVPLVCYQFDLSVGATAGLAGVFVASALGGGTPIAIAILLGIAIGTAVGCVNAVLITRVGVNAVIATLGISIIVGGVVTLKTDGSAVTGNIPSSFTDLGTETTLGVPRTAWVLLLLAGALYYLLAHTPYGRYLYAFGSNHAAARLVGIRTRLVLGMSFVLAGAMAGAAGVLQVARAGSADPRVGESLTLPALAAAFLSAAAVKPGRYNVGGALVAIAFLAVLNNGLNLAGAAEYVNDMVNGSALIVGVALAVRLGGRSETE